MEGEDIAVGERGEAEKDDDVHFMEDMEDKGEENIVVKAIKEPQRPSKAAIAEHELTHIPFRDWCVHCQRGKCVNNPHRSLDKNLDEEREPGVPTTISIDYGYFNDKLKKMT